MVDVMKVGIFGAVAGAATGFVMKLVMPILNAVGGMAPSLNLKLADPTIQVNVRESLSGINTGLSGWLMNTIGITVPQNAMTQIGMGALGGALLFILGAYAAEALDVKKHKVAAIIFLGSLGAALLFKTVTFPPALDITLVNLLIAFGVNAAILAFIFTWADKQFKLGLNPY